MRTVVFEGASPNKLVCDTTLRRMPDGSWVMVMLGGGDKEPLPQNDVYLTRSLDEGRTWSAMERVKLGIKEKDANVAVVPTELSVVGRRATLYFAVHDGHFGAWTTWSAVSDDSCRTFAAPKQLEGELGERTFMRPMIRTRDGRLVLPFQHYLGPGPTQDPRNGVLISPDEGATWTRHGSIRSSTDDRKYSAWAENTVAELSGGELVMFCRAEKGRGRLLEAFSEDGGVTWPNDFGKSEIPNPSSKVALFSLPGDMLALVHNPDPQKRNPLSLWIRCRGRWAYQRVIASNPGNLAYPDGFVSEDKRYLNIVYDDNRSKAVHVALKLPPIVRDAALVHTVIVQEQAKFPALRLTREEAGPSDFPAGNRVDAMYTVAGERWGIHVVICVFETEEAAANRLEPLIASVQVHPDVRDTYHGRRRYGWSWTGAATWVGRFGIHVVGGGRQETPWVRNVFEAIVDGLEKVEKP